MAAVSVGVFGGAFDPPHVGHVELARRGVEHFALDRLLVRVVEDPGHKDVAHRAADPAAPRASSPSRRSTRRRSRSTRSRARSTRSRRSASTIRCSSSAPTSSPPSSRGRSPSASSSSRGSASRRARASTEPAGGRPRGARAPRPRHVLRDRAAARLVVRRSARAPRAGEPIDGLVPPAVEAEIARLGALRGALNDPEAGGMLRDEPDEGTRPT